MRNKIKQIKGQTSQVHNSRRQVRSFSLWLSFMLLVLYICQPVLFGDKLQALESNAPLHTVLWYQFFHINIFHLLTNIWSFLLISFYWHPTFRVLFTGYLVSATVGICVVFNSCIPATIGFSAIIYSLIGIYSFRFINSMRIVIHTLLLIAVTGFLPHVAWQIHLTCFLAGMFYSLLTSPLLDRS